MNIFDWANQVFYYKKDWNTFNEKERKSFQSYMINRIVSMNKDYIQIVNYFQKYSIGLLESREVYKWYCDILPKKKQWNKYIKNRQQKNYEVWLIDIIRKYYKVNSKESITYLNLLFQSKEGKMELKKILEAYGTETKKIRKLKL